MIKFIVNPAGRDWFRPRGKFLALTSNLNNSCLTIFGVKKTYFDGENEMDNRGSKSTIFFNIFVKEQRVDGSWFINVYLMDLRCTLQGFLININTKFSFNDTVKNQKLLFHNLINWNYVKIPSKQFGIKQFSTQSTSTCTIEHNPRFWSGLIDGLGSFTIIVCKSRTHKLNWRVELKFKLGLHTKDYYVLNKLKQHLGNIGNITFSNQNNMANYSISSLTDINKLIIYLDKYPLLTKKYADYLLFKQVVILVNNQTHLNPQGLNDIINIKASMNLGLSPLLKSEFANHTPVIRPKINYDNINLDSDWIRGFVSAEGNFDVRLPAVNTKLGYRVQLRFRITPESRDLLLLEKIKNYIGAGKIYKYNGKNAFSLSVVDFNDITEKVIPLFNSSPIIGLKLNDYIDWCKIHSIMINRSHLTPEGIISIKEIKSGMNYSRSIETK